MYRRLYVDTNRVKSREDAARRRWKWKINEGDDGGNRNPPASTGERTAPPPQMEEVRVDPTDGREYTREQFIQEYGREDGEWNWERAGRISGSDDGESSAGVNKRQSRWDDKPEEDSRAAKRGKAAPSGYQPQLDRAWRFAKFDHVRCNVGGNFGWVCGQVQAVNFVDEGSLLPYLVMLEPPMKRMIAVPYDAPSHMRPEVCFAECPAGGEPAQAISLSPLPPNLAGRKTLRFAVGARVACLTAGPDGSGWPRRWSAGTVRELWTQPKGGAAGAVVPYAVELDESPDSFGGTVLCHRDEHICVRSLDLQPVGECPNETVLQRFTERRNEQSGCDERVDQETFGVRKIQSPSSAEEVAAAERQQQQEQVPCPLPAEPPKPAGLMWDTAQFLGTSYSRYSCAKAV